MNMRTVFAVAAKDIRAIRANLQVFLPMVLVPAVIGVAVPGGLLFTVLFLDPGAQLDSIGNIIGSLPAGALADQLAVLPGVRAQIGWFMANYLLAPFYLLIPLMAASTVTADSFAGEKERGTLESLLLSPATLRELFAGKVAAALTVSLALTLGTFLLTAVTLNLIGWSTYGGPFFPTGNWLPLLVFVIPFLSLAVIFLNVFISARVRTFQAAYQLGGIVVLPALGLFAGQLGGLLLLSGKLITAAGLVLLVADGVLLAVLLRALDRPRLFGSQVARTPAGKNSGTDS